MANAARIITTVPVSVDWLTTRRVDRSTAPIPAAAPAAQRLPYAMATAIVGQTIQVTVSVGSPSASPAGPMTQRDAARQPAVITKSGRMTGRRRARRILYRRTVAALHATITATTIQPATGWSYVRKLLATRITAYASEANRNTASPRHSGTS